MRGKATKNWLKKRAFDRTKNHYLYDKNYLKMQYDAENVFFTSDTDCSGTMECEELFEMFAANGIEVSMEQIKSLFNIVSRNGKLGL